jgi:hypothetical protein
VTTLQAQLFRLRQARLTIAALELDLPKAHQAAQILAPDGHPTGRADGPRPVGSHSDPTGDSLVGFADIDELMDDIDLAITGAVGTLRHCWQDVTTVASRITDRLTAEPVGQGWCRAHCGHWCPGTTDDRLRSGLCSSCDSWSRRNSRPDLSEVQRARRGHEGNCQCDDCKDQRDRTTYRGDAA